MEEQGGPRRMTLALLHGGCLDMSPDLVVLNLHDNYNPGLAIISSVSLWVRRLNRRGEVSPLKVVSC